MALDTTFLTAWQQLRQGDITCQEALQRLTNQDNVLNSSLLDDEVSQRFFNLFPQPHSLPPLIPLLLWQNCYYLGCPVTLSTEEIQTLRDRTLTDIDIIPITEKCYRRWYHARNLDVTHIDAGPLVNPLTGQHDQEDISETTELFLSKACLLYTSDAADD